MAAGPPADLTPAVLLHGFTGAGVSWNALPGALRAGGIAAVAPDLPGHGPEPPAVTRGGYGLEDALATIDWAVSEATEDGRRPLLVGYSMGGRLALHYAVRRPDRLAGLVLESASPGLDGETERVARVSADRELAQRIRTVGVERFSQEWNEHPIFRSQRALPEAVRAEVARQRATSDAEGLASALEGLGTGALPSLWGTLASIELPTLLLAGALDEKFTAIARAMHQQMRTSTLRIVPSAGHRIHLEAAGAWCDAVINFSSALDRTADQR